MGLAQSVKDSMAQGMKNNLENTRNMQVEMAMK